MYVLPANNQFHGGLVHTPLTLFPSTSIDSHKVDTRCLCSPLAAAASQIDLDLLLGALKRGRRHDKNSRGTHVCSGVSRRGQNASPLSA